MRWRFLLLLILTGFILDGVNCFEDIITVPAMGRTGELGDFYNICTHQVSSVNAFKYFPNGTIREQTMGNFKRLFKYVKSLEETSQYMGFEASLEVSALLGEIIISGSAMAVKEFEISKTRQNAYLEYSIISGEESLRIQQNRLQRLFLPDIATYLGVEHVIYAITWGAKVVASLQFQKDVATTHVNLEADMNLGLADVATGTSSTATTRSYKDMSSFTFKLFSDVVLQGKSVTTIDDMFQLLEDVSDQINSTNKGRGQHLYYKLIPISSLLQITKRRPKCEFPSPGTGSHESDNSTAVRDILDTLRTHRRCCVGNLGLGWRLFMFGVKLLFWV